MIGNFETKFYVADCRKCHLRNEVDPHKAEERERRDVIICSVLELDDTRTTRDIAEELGVGNATVARVWKNIHCYKYSRSQEIFPEDHIRHMEFCESVMEKANEDIVSNFIKNIIFIDFSITRQTQS
jgi:hypothetical protein